MKEEKLYPEVAKIYSKNTSICEKGRKEKEIRASLSVTAQTAKVTATLHSKCLGKMETESGLEAQFLASSGGLRTPPLQVRGLL